MISFQLILNGLRNLPLRNTKNIRTEIGNRMKSMPSTPQNVEIRKDI